MNFIRNPLEYNDHRALIERVFANKLGQKIVVDYQLIDETPPEAQEADEPIVRKALEAFDGKIVSKWHNDE